MAKFDLSRGTETGKNELATRIIQKGFGETDAIAGHDMIDFYKYQQNVIGCPTVRELQSDWEGYFDELDNA